MRLWSAGLHKIDRLWHGKNTTESCAQTGRLPFPQQGIDHHRYRRTVSVTLYLTEAELMTKFTFGKIQRNSLECAVAVSELKPVAAHWGTIEQYLPYPTSFLLRPAVLQCSRFCARFLASRRGVTLSLTFLRIVVFSPNMTTSNVLRQRHSKR